MSIDFAGSALGTTFGELSLCVKYVLKTVSTFHPQLRKIESTLRIMELIIVQIYYHYGQLDRLEEIDPIKQLLDEGKGLVNDCLKISWWNMYRKLTHSNKLTEYNAAVWEKFQIYIPLLTTRDGAEMLTKMEEIEQGDRLMIEEIRQRDRLMLTKMEEITQIYSGPANVRSERDGPENMVQSSTTIQIERDHYQDGPEYMVQSSMTIEIKLERDHSQEQEGWPNSATKFHIKFGLLKLLMIIHFRSLYTFCEAIYLMSSVEVIGSASPNWIYWYLYIFSGTLGFELLLWMNLSLIMWLVINVCLLMFALGQSDLLTRGFNWFGLPAQLDDTPLSEPPVTVDVKGDASDSTQVTVDVKDAFGDASDSPQVVKGVFGDASDSGN